MHSLIKRMKVGRNEPRFSNPASQSLNGQLVAHPARRSENMKLRTVVTGLPARQGYKEATYDSVRERKNPGLP